MKKLAKVGIGVAIVFSLFIGIGIVATVLDPTPPKKIIGVEKPKSAPKMEKPKPQKKVVKVEKPKPKPKVQKPVRPEYTAEQVYRFALEYEVRQGQSVADILALGVIAMKGSGHTVEVVERQAQEYSIKGLWVVSCVVVVDGFERTQIRWEADMRNKTVRPLNKVARDLWGY